VNYITSHDGFTLHDLVSYAHKHNEANGEESRDGANDNNSFNFGAEGETVDPGITAAREQQKRNFLATLLLSHGTPMLCAGDEMGRTQKGNNNAYCQDNARSWVNWSLDEKQTALLEFARTTIALRNEQPVLQRRNFFLGATLEDSRFRDLVWFRPDGHEMKHSDWEQPQLRCLGMFLGGDAIATRGPEGHKLVGQSLLIYFNAQPEMVELTLPGREWEAGWQLALRTAVDGPVEALTASHHYRLPGRSLVVFRQAPVV
jgi:glycogen operon protein